MGTVSTKIRCRRLPFRYCRKRPAAMTLLSDDDGLGKKEQEMEEFMHLMYAVEKTAWKSSFSAPVAKRLEIGAKVLDAGCGNGNWILEQANNYPASEFIGLDKTSSVFPSQIRPMNVYFMRGNLLTRLPFDDDTFDYVRMSNMLTVFNKENYEKAITELVRILKPGGYIELSEFEHSPEAGPYFAMFSEEFKLKAQSEKHGEQSFQPSESLPDLLSHTYVLTSLQKAHQRLLIGGRGGRLGMASYEMIKMCFGVIHEELLMSKWALNKEEYMEIVAALLEELNERESWKQPITVSSPQPVYSSITDEKLKLLQPKTYNDVQEMQVGHYLYQFLWQSHFSAPVEEKLISGGRVLDVGCNPGTWLFEIASAYPLTDFIGIDINPLFPSPSDVSQHNIKFVQADVLDKLPFEDDSFDYIRMALFSNTFTHDEWQPALRELIRVLKPGGFIELMEPDFRLQNMGPDSVQLITSLLQYLSLQHVNGEIVHKLQLLLAATNGLGDIDHSVRSLPISCLGGKTGVLLEDSFFIYCNEVVGEPLADFMELSLGEYEELLQRVKKEFVTFETFCRVYRFWAVKNR